MTEPGQDVTHTTAFTDPLDPATRVHVPPVTHSPSGDAPCPHGHDGSWRKQCL